MYAAETPSDISVKQQGRAGNDEENYAYLLATSELVVLECGHSSGRPQTNAFQKLTKTTSL